MIDTTEVANSIYRVSFWDEEDVGDITFPGFSYNLFLLDGSQPAIIQTMFRQTFDRLQRVVSNRVYPIPLRYVIVPHHVGDSSGSLNQWLATSPQAEPVCSELCALLSLSDYADRPPLVVREGDVLDLGNHRLRFIPTPQVTQRDSLMVFEERTHTLFTNDLFSTPGTEISSDKDVSEIAFAVERETGYQPDDFAKFEETLVKLEALDVKLIAPMHGPVLKMSLDKLIATFRNGLKLQPVAA